MVEERYEVVIMLRFEDLLVYWFVVCVGSVGIGSFGSVLLVWFVVCC